MGLLARRISFGLPGADRQSALQLAFSATGLSKLTNPAALAGLPRAYQQGMTASHRRRILGDQGRNAPDLWEWSDATTEIVIFVYATALEAVTRLCGEIEDRLRPGCICLGRLAVRSPDDQKEPFGFRDGLVNPRLDLGAGTPRQAGVDLLPPGEVLLGHADALGEVHPVSIAAHDGSLLVVRQLAQDVRGFWEYFRQQAGADEMEAIWLAAKAVGRWPNGMPVHGSCPGSQPAYDEQAAVSLEFRDDLMGDQCPVGSHIRRAHPRDGLPIGADRSLAVSSQHRLIRRGRVYGDPESEQGILFAALCGDVVRQFEFVQQSWLNNPKHAGRADEVDPIAAGADLPEDRHRHSIPRYPIRRRLNGVTRWVTVRGGGYYLLPSRTGLATCLD
jgi:deferrochelatase/peroxidase EfeB